jgi:hypothetical protein
MTRENDQYSNLCLGIVPIFEHNDRILTAFDSKWKNFFIDEKIIFEVRIDKNKHFVLVGPQLKLQPTKQNPGFKEASINENI